MIERAEALGFDSVWLRDRHLQPGISSPVAIMAAASQRTSRIELGTAVIPLGLENPIRLAEDLATVDVLSGGRINPGVSVGTPMMYDHYKTALYPETHALEDFSKEQVLRLLRALRGEPVSDFSGTVGIERFTDRMQPHSRPGRPRLVRRRPGIGDLGRAAGHQLPDQLRGQRGGRRLARLRHHPGRADRRLPRAPPASREGKGLTGFGGHPHRLGDRRADPPLPRVRRGPVRAHRPRRRAPAGCCSPTTSAPPTSWPTSCSRTPASSAPTRWRSRCRSARGGRLRADRHRSRRSAGTPAGLDAAATEGRVAGHGYDADMKSSKSTCPRPRRPPGSRPHPARRG